MQPRFDRRVALIALVAGCQIICLLGATAFFSSKLRGSIRGTVHDQVLADNIHTARQMTTLIRQLEVGDLRENVASWARLQKFIQDIRLPNDGFVCLTDDSDGAILCHPLLTAPPAHLSLPGGTETQGMTKPGMTKSGMTKPGMTKPGMTKPGMTKPGMTKPGMTKPGMTKPGMTKPGMTKPGMTKPGMTKPGMTKPGMAKPGMTKSASGSGETVTGSVVDYAGELQIIAAGRIPELGATVHVHQLASGIEHNISQVISPIWPLGIGVTIGLVVSTTVLMIGIMRCYDSRVDRINGQLEELVDSRTSALRKTRDAVIHGLAKLAESRDTDTGEHLDRIRLYVTVIGRHLGSYRSEFDDAYIENLSLASSLHDIGKVGIPDAVLLKPGRFAPEERTVMERHSTIGGVCLSAIGSQLGDDDFLELARDITFCHHEKWDGTGYPFGIQGETIPLSARIVALADVYDALRSKRPYKDPMPHTKARQIILAGRGRHFDPEITDAFLACEDEFIAVSERYITKSTSNMNKKVVELPHNQERGAVSGTSKPLR